MNRILALAVCGFCLLAGCTDPALGINIGGEEGNITVSPSFSGSIGNVAVSVGG